VWKKIDFFNSNLERRCKKKNMRKNKKGFTLVELLVAMGIIAIMAAVVVVSLSGQRDKARATAALEIAKSVLPAAMECNMRGTPLNSISVGGAICNGSSVTWPTLDTPSTQGWSWATSYGPTADINNWYYYAISDAGGTRTYVLCPITTTGWKDWGGINNSVLPGSCAVKQ
jgi:type IV pilus assembly protein PilA